MTKADIIDRLKWDLAGLDHMEDVLNEKVFYAENEIADYRQEIASINKEQESIKDLLKGLSDD